MRTNAVTMPRGSPAGPGTTVVRLRLLPLRSDHSIDERKRRKARAQLKLFLASRDNDHMTTFLSTTIEHWPIERLIPYDRNARTHSEEQIEQIARSICEFGFTNPILVDTGAGILAGHARLLAARRVGLAQVPVIVLDHLTDTQKRAYILADNKLALNAGWSDEL